MHCIRVALIGILMLVIAFPAIAQIVDPALVAEQKNALEKQLADYETQIDQFQTVIESKQNEAASFQRDIAILNAQIQKAKLAIKARTIAIEELTVTIGEKSAYVDELLAKVEREKKSIAELMRRIEEMDRASLLESLFSVGSITAFFHELDNFDTIQAAVHASTAEIKTTKNLTQNEIDALEDQKAEEAQLRTIQQLEAARIGEQEAEKQQLLTATKGVEAEYQKLLSARQKDAALIRSQLFLLRGSADIPFEKAVEYANAAFRATGVRPAFLLGVLAEESNLGANVGTGNWNVDMTHPKCASQRTAFSKITSELGLNPDLMPVSKKAWYGYCGGAMGPAQFMPTTWLLYESGISKISGHNPPNPWDPFDAFVAAALLLKDNGAAAGGETAERRAALRYLAGANWNKKAYAFYGDDVVALASKYQNQMDIILAQR